MPPKANRGRGSSGRSPRGQGSEKPLPRTMPPFSPTSSSGPVLMSAGDVLASTTGVVLPGMEFTSGLYKSEEKKVDTPEPKNIEEFTAPDGGNLPPGMNFPSVEEFKGTIDAVNSQTDSGGKEHAATAPAVSTKTQPEGTSGEVGDEEQGGSDALSGEETASDSGDPVNSAEGTSAEILEAPTELEETKLTKPEEVGQTELDDIYNAFDTPDEGHHENDNKSALSGIYPAPSDSLVVMEEVGALSRRVDESDQIVSTLSQQIQLISSSINLLLKENSATTTAITDLQVEIRRLRGVDRSIKDRAERDRLADEQTIAMELAASGPSSLTDIRNDLLRGVDPGLERESLPDVAPTSGKKILFRDE